MIEATGPSIQAALAGADVLTSVNQDMLIRKRVIILGLLTFISLYICFTYKQK